MALNLVRNSKVFFTTNVNANTGVIQDAGFTTANTFEIQVLDGMSFSQSTANESVSVSEAGGDPIRGTRTFNTSLDAASFSFSTYLRPEYLSTTATCEEAVLWNAFLGDKGQYTTAVSIGGISSITYASNGQLTVNGTTITPAGLPAFKPGMIVNIASAPFSAAGSGQINSVNITAAQLASFTGQARVVSITGSAPVTQIVFEYLLKPFSVAVTGTPTSATTLSVLPPNSVVPTGATAYDYSASANTLTVAGVTNYASFSVGSYWVFQGLAGTSGATFNNIPAKVTTSNATNVIFTFATSAVSASSVASANIVATGAYCLNSSWINNPGGASYATMMNSNKNQLIKCGFLIVVDQVTYALDNAVLTEVSIDFGIDAIATAAWSGQAVALRQFSTDLGSTVLSPNTGTFTGTLGTTATVANVQQFTPKNTAAEFLTNKLSTCTLTVNKDLLKPDGTKAATAADTYTIPLTGGSITLSNNVTYLTPAVLAVVNQPIQYFTGNRSVSGSMTAYLKTGITRSTTGNATGNLLNDFLSAAAATVEPYFGVSLAINGSGQSNRVVLDLPNATIGIPAVDVQQVVSTTINFNGQATTGATTPVYDIEGINDIYVRYFAA